jgi:hypothetical protein
LFVSIRKDVLELCEESFRILSFLYASLLLEVSHLGSFLAREGVVNGILVVFGGEQ